MSVKYTYERPELRLMNSRNEIRSTMAWMAEKKGHRLQRNFVVLPKEYQGKCKDCGATVIYIFETSKIIGQAVNEECEG